MVLIQRFVEREEGDAKLDLPGGSRIVLRGRFCWICGEQLRFAIEGAFQESLQLLSFSGILSPGSRCPNHKTMGFVVEEVAEVSPEYLEYTIKDDELDAHYWKPNDFIALSIQGIKDLVVKVDQLEARIAELEG